MSFWKRTTLTIQNENIPDARILLIQKTISSVNSKKNCWKEEFSKKSKNRTSSSKILKESQHPKFKIKNSKIPSTRKPNRPVNSKSISKNRIWKIPRDSLSRLKLRGTIQIVAASTCRKEPWQTPLIMKCPIPALKNRLLRSKPVRTPNKRNKRRQLARRIWKGLESSLANLRKTRILILMDPSLQMRKTWRLLMTRRKRKPWMMFFWTRRTVCSKESKISLMLWTWRSSSLLTPSNCFWLIWTSISTIKPRTVKWYLISRTLFWRETMSTRISLLSACLAPALPFPWESRLAKSSSSFSRKLIN